MSHVLRLCLLLLVATLCALPAGWLLLVCVEMVGFDSLLEPRSGWMMFVVLCASAITLPPVLHAWPDGSRPLSELVRESLRAGLFCFAFCALAFLAGMRPLASFLGLPDLMMSTAATVFAPFIASLLACLSASVCRALLPRPCPEGCQPPSMRWFDRISLTFIVLLLLHPWITGIETSLFPGKMVYPAVLCLLIALRHSLIRHGNAGMVPVWGGLCLLLAFRIGTLLPGAGAAALTFCFALILLTVGSCFCLLHHESRDWLC